MFTDQWSAREQDIAQEWIQRDSEKRCLGRLFGCCPFSCYRRMTIMCYYVTFFTFGVITAAMLVVLAILIFQPFNKPLDYTESNCTTHDKEYDNVHQMSCSCGSGCTSQYPCVKVYVWFITSEGLNITTMLKDSQVSESCTYTPFCQKDALKNKQRVLDYDRDHGALGLQVPCLYDPADATNVIRKPDDVAPFLLCSLLWPGGAALLCALGFLLIYHVCGCTYVCHTKPPDDIKAEAAANPLVAADLTPAGIVITEVPSTHGGAGSGAGDGASQVPLVDESREEA